MVTIDSGEIRFKNGVSIKLKTGISVSCGERLIVKALNGSGKTSFFRQLAGQLNVLSGTKVYGLTMTRNAGGIFDPTSECAFVSQSPDDALFGLPVKHELVCCGATDLTFVQEMCDYFQLGLLLGKSSFQLSEGERIRVCIATAILSTRELLITDEWANHLDDVWVEKVNQLLDHLTQKKKLSTIELFSSHRGITLGIQPQRLELSNTALSAGENNELVDLAWTFKTQCSALWPTVLFSGQTNSDGSAKTIQSLDLKPNKIIGLAGRNGSGKTTLLVNLARRWTLRKKVKLVLSDPAAQLPFTTVAIALRRIGIPKEQADQVCELF
jgi:ABC-type multidrug transport system ATPase subunit